MFSNLILPIIIIFSFLLTLVYLILKKPKPKKRASDTPLFNAHVSNDRPVDLNILDEVFTKLRDDKL